MAHIHGAKTTKAVTEATSAGAAKMMGAAMAGMSKMGEAMTHSEMAGMGKIGETMSHSGMGLTAAGVTATAGKSTLKKILTHPVTLIGFGFALGYLTYKYRKDILSRHHED
jgi:hypothetical protein